MSLGRLDHRSRVGSSPDAGEHSQILKVSIRAGDDQMTRKWALLTYLWVCRVRCERAHAALAIDFGLLRS